MQWFLHIYTAFPRGYCAWVHRAVDMLMQVISTYPKETIYVNHEIIHNTFVIRMFERKWVIFESNIEKIPEGWLIVISAHGTGPSYFARLRSKKIRWIDATCPLVDKVHREAKNFIAKWYHILYIGKRWHQETLGMLDEWVDHITLIEKEEDLVLINGIPSKFALLTQTTLSVDDTEKLIQKIQLLIPDIVLPKTDDICYATTNRQNAVKTLAERCNLILVVWSKWSSNSNKLRDVAEGLWKIAYLIDSTQDIDPAWLTWISSVGITAWASGPEELVVWVVEYLQKLGWKFEKELRVVEEKITFPYTLKIQS